MDDETLNTYSKEEKELGSQLINKLEGNDIIDTDIKEESKNSQESDEFPSKGALLIELEDMLNPTDQIEIEKLAEERKSLEQDRNKILRAEKKRKSIKAKKLWKKTYDYLNDWQKEQMNRSTNFHVHKEKIRDIHIEESNKTSEDELLSTIDPSYLNFYTTTRKHQYRLMLENQNDPLPLDWDDDNNKVIYNDPPPTESDDWLQPPDF